MDLTLLAVLCGLFAAGALGISDFFAAKAARLVGPVTATVAVNLIGAISFIIFYLLSFPLSTHNVTVAGMLYTSIASIVLGLGQITLFQALKIGPVSLVCPLTSIYPLFVTLGVVFFFDADFNLFQLICVLLIILGALAASGIFEINPKERHIGKGPAVAVLTALLWGIGYLILAKGLETDDWQSVSLVQLAIVALTCLTLSPVIGPEERVTTKLKPPLFANKFILSTGIIQMSAMVALSFGLSLSQSLVPVVMAISACYPVLTIILALTHFNEERKLIPLSGALLCVMAIVLLILNSSS